MGENIRYEISANGEKIAYNIKSKRVCKNIVINQLEKYHKENIFAYRIYSETKEKPSHTEIIFACNYLHVHVNTLKIPSKICDMRKLSTPKADN